MNSTRMFRQDRLKYYTVLYGSPDPGIIKKMMLCITNYGLHIVAVYRFGRAVTAIYTWNRFAGFLPLVIYKILNLFVKTIHHADISRDADIGPGLLLMHYYSIIVGPVRAGSNLTLHHNLTMGEQIARLDHSSPRLGDNVWIGPSCVITGGIRIGNGATISAGTVLSKDIPDNSLVSGNPGRIIMHNYDNSIMAAQKG